MLTCIVIRYNCANTDHGGWRDKAFSPLSVHISRPKILFLAKRADARLRMGDS